MFLGEEPRPADHCLGVLGLANALIGAIVMLVLLVIDGLVVPELSDVWAMLLGRTFARWFGWAGVMVGSSVVGSALLSMLDVDRKVLDARVWPVTSSLVVFWFLGTGLVLWRRATASSAGGDRAGEVPVPVGSRSLDVEGALV